jgi:hypothetical protein
MGCLCEPGGQVFACGVFFVRAVIPHGRVGHIIDDPFVGDTGRFAALTVIGSQFLLRQPEPVGAADGAADAAAWVWAGIMVVMGTCVFTGTTVITGISVKTGTWVVTGTSVIAGVVVAPAVAAAAADCVGDGVGAGVGAAQPTSATVATTSMAAMVRVLTFM